MYEGKSTDAKKGAQPAPATHSRRVSQPAFFQPKLAVNLPNDPYEREADAMAEQVMRQVAPAENNTFFQPLAPVVQRKCAACEEEEEHVQRKESNLASPQVDAGFESYVSSLGMRGQPLAAQERGFFEPRFNRDFSNVRIHHDGEAARSAQKINALAYTSGHNIVFNSGQYQPGSDSGKRLLAHELTHVVQQSAAGNQAVNSPSSVSTKIIQRQTEDDTSVLEEASLALLDEVLPVGFGFLFELDGGVTWGYPVYTGASVVLYVSRPSQDAVHVRVRKRGRLALDSGVGFSAMIGSSGRRNRRGAGVGLEAGANAMAGVQGTFVEEYSIPIRDFLVYVGRQVLQTAVSSMAFSGFNIPISRLLELDSERYVIHQRMEGGVFAEANAEVSAGIRRPTANFGGGSDDDGSLRRGTASWGPNSDRNFQGSRPDIRDGDPLALLNFLRFFAGANANLALTIGFDQRSSAERVTTSLFIEGQFGVMLGLPIPIISTLLASLPPDVGGGVEIRIVQRADGSQQIYGVVYIKQGEDQYYAGSAGQQEMVVNLTNLASLDELFDALSTGRLPSLPGPIFLPSLLDKVSYFQRLSLQASGPLGFAALLRRQQGTRSLLSANTLGRARSVYGGGLNMYLDFAADLTGPDFLSIARRLLATAGGAAASLSGANDLVSAYQSLSAYFSGYSNSEDFDALLDDILNKTLVDSAKLRLEVSGGTGIAAAAAKGAKVRFDVSGQIGISCELDFVQLNGGSMALGDLRNLAVNVLNDPASFLPNCPIIRVLYQRGGGNSSHSSRTGSPGPRSASTRRQDAEGGEHETGSNATEVHGYELSNTIPPGLDSVSFTIRDIEGIDRQARVGTQLNIRVLIEIPGERNTVLWVPVQVQVTRNENANVTMEITEPWWIEHFRFGSDVGSVYTYQFATNP